MLSAEVGEDIKNEVMHDFATHLWICTYLGLQALAAGANTFMSKPCKSDALLSEVSMEHSRS